MPVARKRKTPTASQPQQQQSITQHFTTTKHSIDTPTPHSTTTTTKPPHTPADYVQVGTHKLRVGQRLLPLVDSTELYRRGEWSALFERLDVDGVIFVRGVIGTDTVRRARSAILQHIRQKGALTHQLATAAAGDVQSDGGSADDDGRAFIGKTDDGKLTAGWTIDAESGGVNGDREDESATDGWRTLGTSTTLTDVYNGTELKSFLHSLFTAAIQQRQQQYPLYQPFNTAAPVTTFPDCTWLRIRGHKDLTVEHTDYYYFKQERSIFTDHWQPTLASAQSPTSLSPTTCTLCSASTASAAPTLQCALCQHTFHHSCINPTPPAKPRGNYFCPTCANLPFPFYTCWIALGSVHRQHGRLALVPGTHRLHGYEERRGGGDGKLPRQWKGVSERSAVWRSSDMEAGDLLLFNVKTVHGASVNVSDEFRISMDTRVTFAERRQQPALVSPTVQAQRRRKNSGVAMKADSEVDELACVSASASVEQRSRRRSTGGASDVDVYWKDLQQQMEESRRQNKRSKLK